ncbi:MAG: flavin reductase [Opitutae bacterium]|jgi:flavin reductase (DIM6/NTAB) family NADH-FMN oxidoreductase RutF|nr:flavin reductase [Opitutae bacterium]
MSNADDWVTLNLTDDSIWERTYFVHPLVIIGTVETNGAADFAPKHMATPIGYGNWFCFVCTPRHRTFQNVLRDKCFTVSYPPPDQVLMASIAASSRNDCCEKPNLSAIPSRAAQFVKGAVVDNCPLYLECELDRMVDGFDQYSLIIGRIVAAQAKPGVLRDTDRDDGDMIEEHPLLAYLAPGRFATISHTQGFPFPKGFQR